MAVGSPSGTTATVVEARSIADKIVNSRSSRGKSEQIRVDWLMRMAPPVLYFLADPAGIIGYLDGVLGPASLRTGRPFEAGQPAIDLERERLALRRAMKIVSAVFGRCRQFITHGRSKQQQQQILLHNSMRSMGSRLVNASAAIAPLLALAGTVEMAALTLMPYPVDPDDPDLPLARDGLPLATQTRRMAAFWPSLSRDARLAMIASERKSLVSPARPTAPAMASPNTTTTTAWCLCPQCQTRRMGLDELVVMLGATYVDELDRLAAFLEGRERRTTTEQHAVRRLMYRSLALYSDSLLAAHVNILDHHYDDAGAAKRSKRSSSMYATAREMVAEFHRRRTREETTATSSSSGGGASHAHAGATPCVECQRLRKEHGMPSSASESEDAGYAEGNNDSATLLDDATDFGHDSELDGDDPLLGDEFAGGNGTSLFGPDPLEHFVDIKRRAPSSRLMAGLPAHPLEATFRCACHPLEADDIIESFVDADLRGHALSGADNNAVSAQTPDYPQSIVFAESDASTAEGQRIFQMLVSELFNQRLMREYHEAVVRLRQIELLAEVEREEAEVREREASRFAAKARKKERRHKKNPAATAAVHGEEENSKDNVEEEEPPNETAREQPEASKEPEEEELAQETTPKKKKKKKRSKQTPAPSKAMADVSEGHEEDSSPPTEGGRDGVLPEAKDEQSEATATRVDAQTTDDDDPFFLIHSSIGQLSLIDTADEDEGEEEEERVAAKPRPTATSRFESLFSKPVVQAPPGFASPSTSPVATVPASVWSSSLFLPPTSPATGTASAPPPVFGPALLGRSLFLSSSLSSSSISDLAPPGLSKKQP